ncbi:MAG: hypothetical protein ACKVVT_04880 [Dehalococcoidia bacterium]
MEKDLAGCIDLPGVKGAFVCDNAGEVVASSTPAPLATDSMASLGREVIRTLSAFQAAGRHGVTVHFEFNSWTLHARDIDGHGVLVMLAEPGADDALLRITAEITTLNWSEDKKVLKQLDKRNADRRHLVTRASVDEVSRRSWAAFAGA